MKKIGKNILRFVKYWSSDGLMWYESNRPNIYRCYQIEVPSDKCTFNNDYQMQHYKLITTPAFGHVGFRIFNYLDIISLNKAIIGMYMNKVWMKAHQKSWLMTTNIQFNKVV